MWFLDGPEYYSPPGQPPRYLAYQNDVRRVVDSVAAQRHGGVLPLLYKHMVATSYQLALFRCAPVLCYAVQLNTQGPAVRAGKPAAGPGLQF
jgi:hypothetical protein